MKYFFIILSLAISFNLNAQNQPKKNCADLLDSGYMSDGQEYIAKLDENNVAKIYTTFYGGSKYRIVGCTDITEYPLILTVYDTEKNLLFCNKDHNYTPYWNFTFASTIDCIIEIEFDTEQMLKQEVLLLIGFKEK